MLWAHLSKKYGEHRRLSDLSEVSRFYLPLSTMGSITWRNDRRTRFNLDIMGALESLRHWQTEGHKNLA
jgi:hypothetical protein